MARTGGPINWAAQSPGLKPLDSFAVGTHKDFGVFSTDHWRTNFGATSRKSLSGDLSESSNFQTKYALLYEKELKVVWKFMGTT
jgi:hypothetical protein